MTRSPLGLALLSLTLTACSPADPQQQVSRALTDGVVLPIYSAWHEADRQLASSGQPLL